MSYVKPKARKKVLVEVEESSDVETGVARFFIKRKQKGVDQKYVDQTGSFSVDSNTSEKVLWFKKRKYAEEFANMKHWTVV